MSRDEQERWERAYAEGGDVPRRHPTPFLAEWAPEVPRGRALDLATGAGRNALHLAELGFDVTGIDVSATATRAGEPQPPARRPSSGASRSRTTTRIVCTVVTSVALASTDAATAAICDSAPGDVAR